jgi:signal transduction histidine kinase
VISLMSRSPTESFGLPHAITAADGVLHDLGQPLAAIRALVWAPLSPETGPAVVEAADRLRRIGELAELMTALLGSAAKPGRPAGGPADVTAVVLDVVVSVAPGFAGRLCCRARDPMAVPVDALQLRRAVGNLVDNAARAAGPAGQVDIGVRRTGDRVRIEVADDGPGFGLLAPQTGMGLALALDVAGSCGGSLEIQDGPGRGALVLLELPLATPDAA